VSRFRLTFTVDLIGDHEVEDEAAAREKATELYEAYRAMMRPLERPGVLLPVVTVAPHPHDGR
jgi:hypothetical protein